MLSKTMNKSAQCLSPLINLWEKNILSMYGSEKPEYSPIFVVGAPRTGSTILYQTITNSLDVSYIDNLSCVFHRNLFFGMWLSDKLFKNKPHNCFKSIHGNTWKTGGFHAPSECGQFWYRWLPKDHHFIGYDEITDNMVAEIRQNIFAILNYFDRPFVIKNLNVGQRLRLIYKVCPDAKIIWVRRNPEDVIYSILSIRRKLGISSNEWWSIMPSNYKDLLKLDEVEMVVKGVYFIERQINEDIKLFGNGQVHQIYYEEFCKNARKDLHFLEKAWNMKKRSNFELPKLHANSRKSFIEGKIKEQIHQLVSNLDWNFDE